MAQAPKCKACGKSHWLIEPCSGGIAKAAIEKMRGRPTPPVNVYSLPVAQVDGQADSITALMAKLDTLQDIVDGQASRILTLEAALQAITARIDGYPTPSTTEPGSPAPTDEAKKARRREAARLAMARKRAKDSSKPT